MICSIQSKIILILAICFLSTGVVGDRRAFHIRRQDKASITITSISTTSSSSPTQSRTITSTNDEDGASTKAQVETQLKSSTSVTKSSSISPTSTLRTVLPSNINGPAATSVLSGDALYNGKQTRNSVSFYH